jgi:hypothetical protein
MLSFGALYLVPTVSVITALLNAKNTSLDPYASPRGSFMMTAGVDFLKKTIPAGS